jgi:hypothetical protein
MSKIPTPSGIEPAIFRPVVPQPTAPLGTIIIIIIYVLSSGHEKKLTGCISARGVFTARYALKLLTVACVTF